MQISIEGIDGAVKALRAVQGAMSEDNVGRVLLEGAELIRAEAERLAPRDTGQLKGSLKADYLTGGKYGPRAFAAVDFKRINRKDTDKRMNRYPYIVEYGSKPHAIRGKNGKPLFFGGRFREMVWHPGFKGRRFFRDAIAHEQERVKRLIEAKLKALVESVLGPAAMPPPSPAGQARPAYTIVRGGDRYYISGNTVYIPRGM